MIERELWNNFENFEKFEKKNWLNLKVSLKTDKNILNRYSRLPNKHGNHLYRPLFSQSDLENIVSNRFLVKKPFVRIFGSPWFGVSLFSKLWLQVTRNCYAKTKLPWIFTPQKTFREFFRHRFSFSWLLLNTFEP